jgi:Phosphoenolpyruvate phosphomutase
VVAPSRSARPTWRALLARGEPLLLPCAHDALSARLIERAGFSAHSIGRFPLVGARHALPDIGLVAYGEMSAGMRDIMAASILPVLVDGDNGYGDAKNVARTVAGYEQKGAWALFIHQPEEYALGDKALYAQSIKSSLAVYSPDGLQPGRRRDRPCGAQGIRHPGGTRIDVSGLYGPFRRSG